MGTKTAFSIRTDLGQALEELRLGLGLDNYAFIYYVTSRSDRAEVAAGMERTFGSHCLVFGCSSFAEMSDGVYRNGSISAIGVGLEAVEECRVELIDITGEDINPLPAVARLKAHFGAAEMLKEFERYAGLLLIGTSCGRQENLLYALGNYLENLVVGGTAGMEPGTSAVFYQGRVFHNTALLALLKAVRGFETVKTQAVEPVGEETVLVTETGVSERALVSLNGRPAGQVLCERLGILDGPKGLLEMAADHSLALKIQGDFYTRTFEHVEGDTVFTYANIAALSELYVMRNSEEIVSLTGAALQGKLAGRMPQALLFFDCAHRVIYLRQLGQEREYGRLFTAFPHLGFGCGGEAFVGQLNNTLVGLAIL